MTTRAAFVALSVALPVGLARAEWIPPDKLSDACDAAADALWAGKDREEIAERLRPVVEKHRESHYYNMAAAFLADLRDSIGDPPGRDATPDERLADTRIHPADIRRSENWAGGEKHFLKADPNDPAYQLLIRDRKVIDKLIPLLKSRAPIRTESPKLRVSGAMYPQPRVCDVALAVIDYHARCRFFDEPHTGAYFHQLPADRSDKVVRRVREWWTENKDKSVAAGVRAQLAHAVSVTERVWTARALVKVSEGLKTDDKEFGLEYLRGMVDPNDWTLAGGLAPRALGELGDTHTLDRYHDALKAGRASGNARAAQALYLCQYGRRRDWELLTAISEAELRAGSGPDDRAVWSNVLTTETAHGNPYAIPLIGLSLPFADRDSPYALSYANGALNALRRQLGKEFGYKPGGTVAELRAAIGKARTWWDAEGKATYTFDYIEKNLTAVQAPAPGK